MLKWDKFKHFILCFVVTLPLSWGYGLAVGITVELTQAEAKGGSILDILKRLWSRDTFWDLVADAVGIIAGVGLRYLVRKV